MVYYSITRSLTGYLLSDSMIFDNLGVNMPGLKVDLPAMSDKDMEDIHWGIKNDVSL